jgi:hypothetical protein
MPTRRHLIGFLPGAALMLFVGRSAPAVAQAAQIGGLPAGTVLVSLRPLSLAAAAEIGRSVLAESAASALALGDMLAEVTDEGSVGDSTFTELAGSSIASRSQEKIGKFGITSREDADSNLKHVSASLVGADHPLNADRHEFVSTAGLDNRSVDGRRVGVTPGPSLSSRGTELARLKGQRGH